MGGDGIDGSGDIFEVRGFKGTIPLCMVFGEEFLKRLEHCIV